MRLAKYILIFIILLISANFLFASEEVDILNSINNNVSRLSVEITTEQHRDILFEGDEVSFLLAAGEDCYVIALWLTAEGDCVVLLPNSSHPDFHISGGTKYEIPGFNMEKIKLKGPEGTHRIKVIATTDKKLFEKFPKLSEGQDFYIIKAENVMAELKELKGWLSVTPENEWTAYDLKFMVMSNMESTPVASGTPYINPLLLDITNTDPNGVANIDVDALTEQGFNYYTEGKYEDAVRVFTKITEADKNHLYGYYCLGLSFQATGAFDEAIMAFKECLNRKYMEKECYMRVAEIYDQTGDREKAYIRYKLALKTIKDYENTGSLEVNDTTNKRIYDLEVKCENNPSDKDSRMELIAIYVKLDNFSAACYHSKILLEQAVPLYKAFSLETDKPVVEEPVEVVEAQYVPYEEPYYEADYYTYYEPYYEPYIPPPPPPPAMAPSVW